MSGTRSRTWTGRTPSAPVRIAFVGCRGTPEFTELLEYLHRNAGAVYFASINEALADRSFPHCQAVLVAQTRRGEFSSQDVERLHGASPLARIALVFGTWCEGEARSGRPPSGAVRWDWRHAPARLHLELERLERGEGWASPRTATDLDRLMQTQPPWPARSGLLAIDASSRVSYETLADPCQSAGFQCQRLGFREEVRDDAVAVLWDVPHETARRREHLREATVAQVRRAGKAPLVAVLGFPRWDEILAIRQAGGGQVVAKPFLATDLLWRIDRALDAQST